MSACRIEVLHDGIWRRDVRIAFIVALVGVAVEVFQHTTVEEHVAATADIVDGTLEFRVLEIELTVVGVRVVGVLTREQSHVLAYGVMSFVHEGCGLSVGAAVRVVVL